METINKIPWLTILIQPRKTMRYLISLGFNKRTIFILILLSIIAQSLKIDTPLALPPMDYIILTFVSLVIGLLIGTLIVILIFNLCAELLCWTGKWLKGQGKYEEILLALTWSNIPLIASALLWLVLFYISSIVPNPIFPQIFSWLDYLIEIWTLVIFLNCLGEAQNFSIWKAFLNSILAVLVVAIPTAFIVGAGYIGYHWGLGK